MTGCVVDMVYPERQPPRTIASYQCRKNGLTLTLTHIQSAGVAIGTSVGKGLSFTWVPMISAVSSMKKLN